MNGIPYKIVKNYLKIQAVINTAERGQNGKEDKERAY